MRFKKCYGEQGVMMIIEEILAGEFKNMEFKENLIKPANKKSRLN